MSKLSERNLTRRTISYPAFVTVPIYRQYRHLSASLHIVSQTLYSVQVERGLAEPDVSESRHERGPALHSNEWRTAICQQKDSTSCPL